MAVFLSNVFNDPSDPWYYVVGALFLLLIFGALAVYVIFSNNKKKKDNSKDTENTEIPVSDTPTEENAESKAVNNAEAAHTVEQSTEKRE